MTRGFIAALNSVTVDSTGNMSSPETYTLTTSEEKIDLSSNNLGPADVALLTTWLQRPEVTLGIRPLRLVTLP
eukprot:COSAG01_NODE_26_length_36857_cov_31.426166_17_plen_73_part_00